MVALPTDRRLAITAGSCSDKDTVIRWLATATEMESRKQEEKRTRRENVRLEEPTRIAPELHDTLLQTC